MRFWLFLIAIAASVSVGEARAPFLGEATLRPAVGGAVLEVTITPRDRAGDTLQAVWSSQARANLMRCQPRCSVVKAVPVQSLTHLGARTTYRVVLGGTFEPGRKVGLILSFSGGTASVEATVSRDTAGLP